MSVDTRLKTLIGTGTAAGVRVFDTQAPTNTAAPHIVWQEIVGTPLNTHEATATISSTLVQIACYAASSTAAKALRASVIVLIEGNHAAGPISVESIRTTFDEESELYRADADVLVWDGS